MTYIVRLAVIAALVCLIVFFMVGCKQEGEDNKDPRIGVVQLEPCGLDGCYGAWKVCAGSDLLFYTSTYDQHERVVRNSQECKP
jgi:hypothetical protein